MNEDIATTKRGFFLSSLAAQCGQASHRHASVFRKNGVATSRLQAGHFAMADTPFGLTLPCYLDCVNGTKGCPARIVQPRSELSGRWRGLHPAGRFWVPYTPVLLVGYCLFRHRSTLSSLRHDQAPFECYPLSNIPGQLSKTVVSWFSVSGFSALGFGPNAPATGPSVCKPVAPAHSN